MVGGKRCRTQTNCAGCGKEKGDRGSGWREFQGWSKMMHDLSDAIEQFY